MLTMNESRTLSEKDKNKSRDDTDKYSLKYSGSYPVHAAVAANDPEAVVALAKRRDTDSYDQNGRTPIQVAAVNGHTECIQALLQYGADLNGPERTSGRTALHFACLKGYQHAAQLLIKNGAVIYDQDKTGAFPIHLAAEGGHSDIIILLKNHGADVSCKDKNAAEPMHYAAKHNHLGVITALHQLGASVQALDKNGATPMHYAVVENNCDAIRKLADLGADVNAKCNLGETPLHYATRSANLETIITLSKLQCDFNARNKQGECAIHIAAAYDIWQSIYQLAKVGADLTIPYKKKIQAIHIAAESGSCEAIRYLKKCKVDLNAEDKSGNRPIHYAVRSEQMESIQKLVELGADINAPRKRGQTPLHMATKDKKVKVTNLLGSLGADCNAEDESYLVPLYYAVVNEDPITAKNLKRYGAQVNSLNSEGDGMVHILVEEEKLDGLKTLRDLKANFSIRNKDGDTCVHQAVAALQINTLKHLGSLGADFNMQNKHGLTALHVAVMEGKGDRVDLLNDLGAGLDFETQDFKRDGAFPRLVKHEWMPKNIDKEDIWKHRIGLSAVHLSVLHDHKEILSHLVTCGANINATDAAGETVFHLAVFYDMLDWLQTLITLGADRNAKDKLGRSPLHYASHTGNIDILRFLLKYGAIITETDNEGRQPLHYAAQEGHYLLLPEFTVQNRPVELDCLDNNGRTPLHFACEKGMVDTIQELVHIGADKHAKDQQGNTVIHTAAAGGAQETIVLLASLGCNMDIQNKDMKTPLHVAADFGKGEAMEYLLMCGCNPNIKDKDGLFPNTYKLKGPAKHDIVRRIKQYNQLNSTEHKTGEVCYDCSIVQTGRLVDLEKLGIQLKLDCEKDVNPLVFIYRTPPDARQMEIPLRGLEEILSDVYELRVLCMDNVGTMTISIPMDGYPGKFEACIRTSTNDDYKDCTTSEENGVPILIGKIPVAKCFTCKFAVVVHPRVYEHSVGHEYSKIISDVDRRLRIEVPEGAFDSDTSISLQVLKTDHIERSSDMLFATDVVNITSQGAQPQRKLKLQLPIHNISDAEDENVVVFCIRNEDDLQNEHRWTVAQSHPEYTNGCITLAIEHFSMYIGTTLSRQDKHLTIDARKRQMKDKIRLALQRETSVLFFCAISPRKDKFLTIFECTSPGKFKRRSEYWENEGFIFHPTIQHSGHFVARPNQKYNFSVSGNFQFLDEDISKMALVFNPRSYKYHSFYMRTVDKKQPMIGEFKVTTSDVYREEEVVTSLPIEIPLTKSCLIS